MQVPRRTCSRLLAALAAATLIAGGLDVVVRVGSHGNPISPQQALARYRATVAGASEPGMAGRPTARPHRPAQASAPGSGRPSPPTLGRRGPRLPATTSPVRGQPLPLPGVYVYATSGYEQVAVPGSRRDFPRSTAITVQPYSCGVVETWQPFQQHTERTVVCAARVAPVLASYYVSVSFYGQTDTTTVTCRPDAYLYLNGAAVGRTWSYTCSSAKTTARNRARVIGYQTLTVHGQPVRTVHVHVDTVTSGPNGGGSSPADYWFAATNGLLIRNTGAVHGNGTAHYYETYDLQLTDLQPQT